jgi:phosphoribosyl 1,2-cyclic phosphate phosphodiesterase
VSARLRVTILGCGSSGGVPRLGGRWGACDPANPKNRRRRCSILVERFGDDPEPTRILVDAGPDMREQLLDAGVGALDAVLFTHEHADHIHGIDDLRQIVFNRRARLPVWAPPGAARSLRDRFAYLFAAPEGSLYPPILDLHEIHGEVVIGGRGGPVAARSFAVPHGSIEALGFVFGPVAYLPDVAGMTEAAWDAVTGLDCWIVDALRYEPHYTHSHLSQTLGWIARAGVGRGVITNMHIDLDYATVEAETPHNVSPAFDGMALEFDIPS